MLGAALPIGLWRPVLRLLVCAAAFVRSRRGIAATEFALLVPVMVLLYAGAGEIAQAAMTSRRMENLSRTLVDLVAQQPTSGQILSTPAPANATQQSDLNAMFAAASAVLAPSPLDTLQMTVTAVDIVNNSSGLCCAFRVRWSDTQNGILRPCGFLTAVPPAQTPSPSTISSAMTPPFAGQALAAPVPMLIADVSYTYTSLFSTDWLSFPAMQRTSYMLPRTTGQVIAAAPLATGKICF